MVVIGVALLAIPFVAAFALHISGTTLVIISAVCAAAMLWIGTRPGNDIVLSVAILPSALILLSAFITVIASLSNHDPYKPSAGDTLQLFALFVSYAALYIALYKTAKGGGHDG